MVGRPKDVGGHLVVIDLQGISDSARQIIVSPFRPASFEAISGADREFKTRHFAPGGEKANRPVDISREVAIEYARAHRDQLLRGVELSENASDDAPEVGPNCTPITRRHRKADRRRRLRAGSGQGALQPGTAPLFGRLATIKKAVKDGQEAQRQLEETCEDEGILAEYELVVTDLSKATNRRSQLQVETRQMRELAESDRDEADRGGFRSKIEKLLDRAEDREAKADQNEAELEDVFEQIAELERREEAVRKRMLEP